MLLSSGRAFEETKRTIIGISKKNNQKPKTKNNPEQSQTYVEENNSQCWIAQAQMQALRRIHENDQEP